MKKSLGIILTLVLILGMAGSLVSAETMVYSSGFQGICKQGTSNGFYYMYRDVANGGTVQEFPAFNVLSIQDEYELRMAWTLSTTQIFPFMTNYSYHPEVGLNPILQWRAPSDGTVLYRVVEMGATFYAEDGEVRKTAIFMNDKGGNDDGVTVTLYLNDQKNSPIKQGLVSSSSDFTFDETIEVKAGDTINLEYDSNTTKNGDATYGLFELTFIEDEAATPTTAPTTAPTIAPTEEISSADESQAESVDGSAVQSEDESTIASSEDESQNASEESAVDSQADESSVSSVDDQDDTGFPVWAIVLIAIVVLGGAGAVIFVVNKNKK